MRSRRRGAVLIAAGLVVLGCAAKDELVFDEHETIKDGEGLSYPLDAGKYQVEVTASDDGATVKFVGAPCPGSETETQSFSTICEFGQTGQLLIDNPDSSATESDCTVTVKVTRLAK